jgi:metal-responsive CopG/Arc/MetJ family transcriptional regulator
MRQSNTIVISGSLPTVLAIKLEQYLEENKISKSTFIRQAVEAFLDKEIKASEDKQTIETTLDEIKNNVKLILERIDK